MKGKFVILVAVSKARDGESFGRLEDSVITIGTAQFLCFHGLHYQTCMDAEFFTYMKSGSSCTLIARFMPHGG
jgi:hypothetical protein